MIQLSLSNFVFYMAFLFSYLTQANILCVTNVTLIEQHQMLSVRCFTPDALISASRTSVLFSTRVYRNV
uniref:Uncharacterized protein n=1 Tax=Anguilla anguilla TaxID=7936 RepID=A0A0E9VUX7_ANGAN